MSQAAEDRADLELFLDEARRFVHNRLQPAVSRHETLISPPLLADITREAANLGLLPLPGQEAGYGLWEQPEQATNTVFSLAFLKLTASINAGVAFSWHRYALAVASYNETGIALVTVPENLRMPAHPWLSLYQSMDSRTEGLTIIDLPVTTKLARAAGRGSRNS